MQSSDVDQEENALTILEERCMKKYGFDLTLPPLLNPDNSGTNSRRYGTPASLRIAQQYGFHMTQNDPRSMPKHRGRRLSDAEKSVLIGATSRGTLKHFDGASVPQGGCAGQANRAIAGADKHVGQPNLPASIQASSFQISQQDPRVIAAQGKWSQCMRAQGYQYNTTFDAIGDARWGSAYATSQEIATATASWHCAQKANLVGIWTAVETAYQNQQIDAHAEELKQTQVDLHNQMQHVAQIVGAAASPAP
jgi:hypothetical protein